MTKRQRTPDRPDRKRPTGDYQVGYCRPPKDRQFQPGSSGNRKGRPKQSRSLKAVLEQALREAIAIREGGRKRKRSRMDVLVRTLVNDALQGKAKAVVNLIALLRVTGLGSEEAIAPESAPSRSEDEAVLHEFLRRHGVTSVDALDESSESSEDQSEPDRAEGASDEDGKPGDGT
jgi:hypothetical protein